MPQQRKHPETVRTTTMAKTMFTDFVDTLSTTTPVTPVSEGDLVGALIYAAWRSPREAVKANVDAFRDYESDRAAEFAAIVVVARFMAHFGRAP